MECEEKEINNFMFSEYVAGKPTIKNKLITNHLYSDKLFKKTYFPLFGVKKYISEHKMKREIGLLNY